LLPPSAEIAEARIDWATEPLSGQVANALHWVNLISGRFFVDQASRFNPTGRVDQVLLSNLRAIRQELHEEGMRYETAHDLLGRTIFVQFLFQRTDSDGRAALNETVLNKLATDGTLSRAYSSLQEILSNHDDAYSLFRWLNDRFNGDLFPGKGATPQSREKEWQDEIAQVRPKHLKMLAEFVGGETLIESGQRSLFPLYSFDTIPLELISSIYEEFVGPANRGSGTHYTPGHVVDLMLDSVLPWNDPNWNVRVLDPACGSGIFLVKAFQRLVYRWKLSHRREEPTAGKLRNILENNLFGIDINAEAVRVASFSLYLAMCDEIDPKYYWTQVQFPRLRNRNLHAGDFFDLKRERPDLCRRTFDLVVGNAPWGQGTITSPAKEWARAKEWSVSYGALGPLFLPYAAQLTARDGIVSMLEPSNLLTNTVTTSRAFRRRLLSEFKIEEIVNLSALRFGLFASAIDPACIVTLRPTKGEGDLISYVCPKPMRSSLDDYRITLDSQDTHFVSPYDAARDDRIWSVLIWGGSRDLSLVRRLSGHPTLADLKKRGVVRTREGIIRGDKKKTMKALLGRRILESAGQKNITGEIDASDLPINDDDRVHSRESTDLKSFELPQLIIKQGWSARTGRFEAGIVRNSLDGHGVLCSQSFISVSSDPECQQVLDTACDVYNSILAVYYLLLTSGRFASYRPEPTATDLLSLPIPKPRSAARADSSDHMRDLFELTEAELSLVEDLFQYTLPDFKGDSESPGRLRTARGAVHDELERYCETFMRVLKSGFGEEKHLAATVFEEIQESDPLPLRMLVIHLDLVRSDAVVVRRESIQPGKLLEMLQRLRPSVVNDPKNTRSGALRNRPVRIYTSFLIEERQVPSVVLIKPDQMRYWTRAAALYDADEVAADIMRWSTRGVFAKRARVH